jgi:hypothetical protein
MGKVVNFCFFLFYCILFLPCIYVVLLIRNYKQDTKINASVSRSLLNNYYTA